MTKTMPKYFVTIGKKGSSGVQDDVLASREPYNVELHGNGVGATSGDVTTNLQTGDLFFFIFLLTQKKCGDALTPPKRECGTPKSLSGNPIPTKTPGHVAIASLM